MADDKTVPDRELMRRWVETRRRAGPELEEIRRREIEATITAEVIWQLIGSAPPPWDLPPRTTSGLVEQRLVRQAAPMTPLLAAALELQTFFDQ